MKERKARQLQADEENLYAISEEDTLRKFTVTFESFEEGKAPLEKVVTIKIIDIVFNDKQCSLVYM